MLTTWITTTKRAVAPVSRALNDTYPSNRQNTAKLVSLELLTQGNAGRIKPVPSGLREREIVSILSRNRHLIHKGISWFKSVPRFLLCEKFKISSDIPATIARGTGDYVYVCSNHILPDQFS
ncbi:hypothetical protein PHIN3_177 [Sinorhizobium phage phiN3]|uniref:Uncharacterized protein n=1 Tax=Sinorhizobium phage phiN3 TaxID=1647405 RepID=A0A0F6WCJ9_9CAUD|nr:hypothetical protein AVT40_gp356 [Sinorhizobium phage phiN3]AKF13440.1 hypothetical protein PHIN3_177 [Sinorhizobium phage phiN3]